jgi:hypothetical protein
MHFLEPIAIGDRKPTEERGATHVPKSTEIDGVTPSSFFAKTPRFACSAELLRHFFVVRFATETVGATRLGHDRRR